MPKIDMNYQNTIIYKIVCKDLSITDCYVGSTTNFIQRKYRHKTSCNNINNKAYKVNVYVFIRANYGWENWDMIEIEKYPCNDLNEALKRERYWIETLKATLNKVIPSRTQKEYREDNKNKILNHQKIYYQNNADKIKADGKLYYENNADKIKATVKQYALEHPDKKKEHNKAYREANADKIKEYKKQYAKDNAEKIKEYKRQYYLNKQKKQLEEKTQSAEI